MKIPPKDLRFMMGLKKPNDRWVDGKFIFHSLITVLLLGLCFYVLTPVFFMFSGYFIILNMFFLPLIRAAQYERSAVYLEIFRWIEKVYASIGLIYIFKLLIKIEVVRNIANMNYSTEQTFENIFFEEFLVEWIIILLTEAVAHINGNFFEGVVANKKREICPALIITWKTYEGNQLEEEVPPKYEEFGSYDNPLFYQHDHDNQVLSANIV